MSKGILLVAALLLPAAALGQSKQEDVERLLEQVQLDRRIEASNRVMRAAFIRGMRNRSSSNNPAVARLVEEEYDAAFPASRVIADVHPKVAALYDGRFSQDEVRELRRIYASPLFEKHRALDVEVGRLILEATRESVKAGMGDLMKKVMDRAVAEGHVK